jgi:hypothetical protein
MAASGYLPSSHQTQASRPPASFLAFFFSPLLNTDFHTYLAPLQKSAHKARQIPTRYLGRYLKVVCDQPSRSIPLPLPLPPRGWLASRKKPHHRNITHTISPGWPYLVPRFDSTHFETSTLPLFEPTDLPRYTNLLFTCLFYVYILSQKKGQGRLDGLRY